MGKILPILFALIGLGAGLGAGVALRPDPVETVEMNPCGELPGLHTDAEDDGNPTTDEETNEDPDFVKLNNQFVVPVVGEGAVTALVVISLSLEVTSGGSELIYQREPKLRDIFLQVLFEHANTGGFDGDFTTGRKMDRLRSALRESAVKIVGPTVTDVLISNLVRQDV